MSKIHYFPRYSQPENFSTNNTLLLFLRIYDLSRFTFEKVLNNLLKQADVDVAEPLSVGLQITQQVGNSMGIPDGSLSQSALRVVIETRLNAGAFDCDQLRRHLNAFQVNESGWLILLSPEQPRVGSGTWAALQMQASEAKITLVAVTFMDIIRAVKANIAPHNEQLRELLDDYEEFCSSKNLLPNNEWTMFVPPCGKSYDINLRERLYFCPLEWSRRRGRFLGIYKQKAVRQIGVIAKILHFNVDTCELVGENVSATTDELRRMKSAAKDFGLHGNYQFYMCNDMVDCDFRKSDMGGIAGHRYIDIRKYIPGFAFHDLNKLSSEISKCTWQDATNPN